MHARKIQSLVLELIMKSAKGTSFVSVMFVVVFAGLGFSRILFDVCLLCRQSAAHGRIGSAHGGQQAHTRAFHIQSHVSVVAFVDCRAVVLFDRVNVCLF